MTISSRLRRLLAPLPLTIAAGVVALAGCGSTTTVPAIPSTAASSTAQPSGPPTTATATPGGSEPSAASESNPPGDIPDNQAYVTYQPQGGGWQVKVPEGWAQTNGAGGSVTFTDKLNAVQVTRRTNATPPTPASVKAAVTTAEGSRPGFALARVDTVKRAAGTGYRAVYRVDARADPVTGKTVNNDVEQYTFWRNGTQVDLRLSGPHGADNVDPWKIITDSFRWA